MIQYWCHLYWIIHYPTKCRCIEALCIQVHWSSRYQETEVSDPWMNRSHLWLFIHGLLSSDSWSVHVHAPMQVYFSMLQGTGLQKLKISLHLALLIGIPELHNELTDILRLHFFTLTQYCWCYGNILYMRLHNGLGDNTFHCVNELKNSAQKSWNIHTSIV